MADDMGYGDLGCYGATKIPTPNIDRMAAEGIRFTDAHSPASLCTPTRYSVLTGRYCWRSKLTHGVLKGFDPLLIDTARPHCGIDSQKGWIYYRCYWQMASGSGR